MSKKRKTPPSPRTSPGFSVSVATDVPMGERDTDEEDRGEFLDDEATVNMARPSELEPSIVLGDVLLDDMAETSAEDLERVSDRRLTPTLLRIFARRRQQVGVSIEQVARLSGIAKAELQRWEDEPTGLSITFDKVVALARVLGLSADELPGMRRREERFPLGVTLAELERALLGAPLLRFQGVSGERFGGDVERAAASKAFSVRIEDDTLSPALSRGALLGFMSGARARPGATVLLRHRRSALMAMRRVEPTLYAGIMPWQPSYPIGGEWHLSGSLEVVIPPR